MAKMNDKTIAKIIAYVAERDSVCTTAMLWMDRFPKTALKTVRARVQALVEAGRLQYAAEGEHVHPETLELTDTERKERAIDKRVKERK